MLSHTVAVVGSFSARNNLFNRKLHGGADAASPRRGDLGGDFVLPAREIFLPVSVMDSNSR
jgi:hypothetical protein